MKRMNLSYFKTPRLVYKHFDEILECEYMSNYPDALYINVYSDENDPKPFDNGEGRGGVYTAELDRISNMFPIFNWSMGEVFMCRKLMNRPLVKKELLS